MVLEYLKNFVAKLILVPVLVPLGLILLAVFVLAPQFRLFREPRRILRERTQ
jgi:hypothetical protein